MNNRYFIYSNVTNILSNIIIWDGISPYEIGQGYSIEIAPAGSYAGIGWTRDANGEYHPPVESETNEQEAQS